MKRTAIKIDEALATVASCGQDAVMKGPATDRRREDRYADRTRDEASAAGTDAGRSAGLGAGAAAHPGRSDRAFGRRRNGKRSMD